MSQCLHRNEPRGSYSRSVMSQCLHRNEPRGSYSRSVMSQCLHRNEPRGSYSRSVMSQCLHRNEPWVCYNRSVMSQILERNEPSGCDNRSVMSHRLHRIEPWGWYNRSVMSQWLNRNEPWGWYNRSVMFQLLWRLFPCAVHLSGEFYQLWSTGLLRVYTMITEIKVFFPEVEHYLLKQFTTKQQVQYSKKTNEWVPCEIQMFPLNIILHGWPLPADLTCPGLHADSHLSPNWWNFATLCSSAYACNGIRKRDRTLHRHEYWNCTIDLWCHSDSIGMNPEVVTIYLWCHSDSMGMTTEVVMSQWLHRN